MRRKGLLHLKNNGEIYGNLFTSFAKLLEIDWV